jgi:hypothetical protein
LLSSKATRIFYADSCADSKSSGLAACRTRPVPAEGPAAAAVPPPAGRAFGSRREGRGLVRGLPVPDRQGWCRAIPTVCGGRREADPTRPVRSTRRRAAGCGPAEQGATTTAGCGPAVAGPGRLQLPRRLRQAPGPVRRAAKPTADGGMRTCSRAGQQPARHRRRPIRNRTVKHR